MTCFVSRPSGIALVKFHSLQVTIKTNLLVELKHQAPNYKDTHIEYGGLDKKAIHAKLKEAKSAYGTKHGKPEFQGWYLQGSALMGSTSTPVALAGGTFGFAGGAYGGHAYHPGRPAGQNRIPARGEKGASGHYGPTYAHAGRGEGYHRGRGGFGSGGRGGRGLKPVCGACSRKGVVSDHSHRVCPLTTCNHCHQNDHVKSNCPNPYK